MHHAAIRPKHARIYIKWYRRAFIRWTKNYCEIDFDVGTHLWKLAYVNVVLYRFTIVTVSAATHKLREYYGNELTNKLVRRVWKFTKKIYEMVFFCWRICDSRVGKCSAYSRLWPKKKMVSADCRCTQTTNIYGSNEIRKVGMFRCNNRFDVARGDNTSRECFLVHASSARRQRQRQPQHSTQMN